jgi:hypothetical protein
LYQGTTLVVPQTAQINQGFSSCYGKIRTEASSEAMFTSVFG